MILLEARLNITEAKKRIVGICDSREERWRDEGRLEFLCNVEGLTLYVIVIDLLNTVFVQFFLEKADSEDMFDDITYLVEKVERYIAENREKVKVLLRRLGEALDAVFAAVTPYPYSIFTLDFRETLFHKLLETPCAIDILLIRNRPSLLAHLIARLVQIHAQKTEVSATEIFKEPEIGTLFQLAQCLRGRECALESARALLQQLQHTCPTEIDGDVAVIRRTYVMSAESKTR
jgi:hypothetical protein